MRSFRALTVIVAAFALAACTAAKPGWTYAPAPSATPIPSIAPSESAPAPSESAPAPSPSASATAGASSGAGTVVEIVAEVVAFVTTEATVPADQAFQIAFKNRDAGLLHNVEIKDASGASLFKGEIFPGVDERVYDVPPLAAGAYTFVCTVHPNMTGTLTAG